MKKTLITAALIFASLAPAFSQDDESPKPTTKDPGTLIADETMLFHMASGKLKVQTFNQTLATKMIKTFSPCQCFTYSFAFKKATSKGRTSKEECWTFYFKPEDISESKITQTLK